MTVELSKSTHTILGLEAAIDRRRANVAQNALASWYMLRFTEEKRENMMRNNVTGEEQMQVIQAFRDLGPDAVQMFERFQDLEPYELETITDLRDLGVTVPEMIDYLRASSGFNAEGRPVRHELATNLRQREFREKSQKIEARSRTGFAAAAAVGAAAIGIWMLATGDVAVGSNLPPVISQPLGWAMDELGGLFKNLMMGGALIGSWKAYKSIQDIRSGTPKLDIGKDEDFRDLQGNIGRPDYDKLNAQYESISMTDRHLVKHLSPTELRFFLLGGDQTRLHLLRANPPSQRELLESAVENIATAQASWKKNFAVAWLLFSSPFRREKNDARIPDLADRMAAWRRNAEMNRQAQGDVSVGEVKEMGHPRGASR